MDSKKLPPNPAAAFWSALRTLNLYYCAQLTFTKLIYVLFNDLSLIIRSAGFADAMRYCESTTLAALDQCRSCHLPMTCSGLVTSCRTMFILLQALR